MRITHLNKIYKGRYDTVHAINDVNLDFNDKGMVFIVGVSGSGKSTLMNMLSGVDAPTSGEILINDKNIFSTYKNKLFGYRNSYVGLIFQDYNLIEDLNVYDNIKLTMELLGKFNFELIDEIIKKVDIEDIKYSKVNEISSGQMQRVAIARALVKDSSMILADEPTGNLDSKNGEIVLNLLKEISKDRLVIIITHDDDAAIKYADRIIEIEDGKILNDSSPICQNTTSNENLTFKKPKITLKKQLEFMCKFMKSNIVRTISLFIVMILLPIIGNICCGYAFFDITKSYKDYQDKYGSNYLALSKKNGDYSLYYSPNEYMEIYEKYSDSNLIERFDVNININPLDKNISTLYKPNIDSILIYNNSIKIEGSAPLGDNEVVISDYLNDAFKYYYGSEQSEIVINDIYYSIVGIVKTNYLDFQSKDMNDKFVKMAYEENMCFYNSIITNEQTYFKIIDKMTEFSENIAFRPYNDITTIKYEELTILRNKEVEAILEGTGFEKPGFASFSTAYLEALGLDYEATSILGKQVVVTCFSKTKYRLKIRIGGIYESDKLEIVMKDSNLTSDFLNYIHKSSYCRLLISKDDINYSDILKTQDITNESFKYANSFWQKSKNSKIAVIELLVVLIVIMIAFSSIINSLTLNLEKKKIGIKYSFGIDKFTIILPYIYEYLVYIIIGVIVSSLSSIFIYPLIMNNIIFNDIKDIIEFSFYYISSTMIFGWDIIIIAILLTSLAILVYRVCRKNPIEIIKDL